MQRDGLEVHYDKPEMPKRRSDYKLRASRRKRVHWVPRIRAPVPTTLKTKMIYSETYSVNPGLGGLTAVAVFSANGLFDPNIQVGGHQPRGFDQLMAMYDHYFVEKSRIKVVFENNNAVSSCIFVNVRDSATTSSNSTDYLESDYTVWTGISDTTAGGNTKTLTKVCDVPKFLGRPAYTTEIVGSASANPLEQAYFHIGAFAADASTDQNTVYFTVTIEYDVHLVEPKMPASS